VKARFGLNAALVLALIGLAGCGLWGGGRLGPAAAQEARRYLGVPYKPGGIDPRGFDCSGLTFYVYNRLGLELPRSSADQAAVGRRIRRNNLRAGDLVFFSTGRGKAVTHVGIYLGGRKFIHAPGQGKTVVISEMDSDYFSRNYHSARRVS
jgi:cell wall-associated NlpC family hydrolase